MVGCRIDGCQAHRFVAEMRMSPLDPQEVAAANRAAVNDDMHVRMVRIVFMSVKRGDVIIFPDAVLSVGVAVAKHVLGPISPRPLGGVEVRSSRKTDDEVDRQVVVQPGIELVARQATGSLINMSGKSLDIVWIDCIGSRLSRIGGIVLVTSGAHENDVFPVRIALTRQIAKLLAQLLHRTRATFRHSFNHGFTTGH